MYRGLCLTCPKAVHILQVLLSRRTTTTITQGFAQGRKGDKNAGTTVHKMAGEENEHRRSWAFYRQQVMVIGWGRSQVTGWMTDEVAGPYFYQCHITLTWVCFKSRVKLHLFFFTLQYTISSPKVADLVACRSIFSECLTLGQVLVINTFASPGYFHQKFSMERINLTVHFPKRKCNQ